MNIEFVLELVRHRLITPEQGESLLAAPPGTLAKVPDMPMPEETCPCCGRAQEGTER